MSQEKEKKEKDSKDSKEKAPATPEEEAGKGKKKKLIMFIAIGLLVVGGGAAAAMFFLSGSKKTPAEETKGEGEHGEAEGDAHGEAGAEEGGAHGEAKKEEGGHGEAKKEEGGHGGGHGEAKKDDGHGGGAKKDEKEAGAEYSGNFGATYRFAPFHLNLGNPIENRYVRLELVVEYKGGKEQEAEIKAREPQLRDGIVTISSRKTREHLLSPDGKDQLRLEIKNKINQFMDKKVENVYITDILIE